MHTCSTGNGLKLQLVSQKSRQVIVFFGHNQLQPYMSCTWKNCQPVTIFHSQIISSMLFFSRTAKCQAYPGRWCKKRTRCMKGGEWEDSCLLRSKPHFYSWLAFKFGGCWCYTVNTFSVVARCLVLSSDCDLAKTELNCNQVEKLVPVVP